MWTAFASWLNSSHFIEEIKWNDCKQNCKSNFKSNTVDDPFIWRKCIRIRAVRSLSIGFNFLKCANTYNNKIRSLCSQFYTFDRHSSIHAIIVIIQSYVKHIFYSKPINSFNMHKSENRTFIVMNTKRIHLSEIVLYNVSESSQQTSFDRWKFIEEV